MALINNILVIKYLLIFVISEISALENLPTLPPPYSTEPSQFWSYKEVLPVLTKHLPQMIQSNTVSQQLSFTVDYKNDCFLKDGKPFRYVSGTMHYFRVPYQLWSDRLHKMKMAGLNALETYIEWSGHEPEPGVYNFDYNYDLVSYLMYAQAEGLLVILRPGPFIDAERDMGGLPYWLMRLQPNITLRTYDETYIKYVNRWYSVLYPMIRPLLYENGGPVIMVQIENEYGSLGICDSQYTSNLLHIAQKYLGNNVVLFTTDGSLDKALTCGRVDQTLSTQDFGTHTNVAQLFQLMRWHRSKGPLANSEFYPGWLDHWGAPHANIPTNETVKTLDDILSLNASVNIYVFHGGTSFGFTAGSNLGSNFQACPTSYDYDAPLTEAGDPTPKYFAIRETIGKYLPLPSGTLPTPAPKLKIGPVALTKKTSLFDFIASTHPTKNQISSTYPLPFEDLYQPYGFVLYETDISFIPTDPILLTVPKIADRGYVYVQQKLQGILSREQKIESLPLKVLKGQLLSILVENQGRVCFGNGVKDRKGIFQNVTLGSKILNNWRMTRINLDSSFIQSLDNFPIWHSVNKINSDYSGAAVFTGTFKVNSSDIEDTFLRLDGWHKGVAFINGFNLGRYWPIVGPQVTLYVPKTLLSAAPTANTITILELEQSPCALQSTCFVSLVDKPVINGTTPEG